MVELQSLVKYIKSFSCRRLKTRHWRRSIWSFPVLQWRLLEKTGPTVNKQCETSSREGGVTFCLIKQPQEERVSTRVVKRKLHELYRYFCTIFNRQQSGRENNV